MASGPDIRNAILGTRHKSSGIFRSHFFYSQYFGATLTGPSPSAHHSQSVFLYATLSLYAYIYVYVFIFTVIVVVGVVAVRGHIVLEAVGTERRSAVIIGRTGIVQDTFPADGPLGMLGRLKQ